MLDGWRSCRGSLHGGHRRARRGGLGSRIDQVTIADVKVRISDHGPVVLLQAEGKTIPIFVDLTVAVSIQGALNGEQLHGPCLTISCIPFLTRSVRR